jgi:NAD(P)-dependent dehydrogenase (short-subunit alcohol dehydrogenase family)
MFDDLADKTILVVGASRGIGKQLALTLHGLGAKLHLAARNPAALEELTNQLGCATSLCDIDREADLDQLAQAVPPLDGICIVSGVVKLVPPKLLSKKMVDPQILTNLAAPLCLVGALLKRNKVKEGASIIFTSAGARLNQVSCTAPYAGAKLGLHGAARSLAADLVGRKIRVNTVSFDYVETEMIKDIKEIDTDRIVGVSPVQYSSTPYLFLLSKMSRWTTGQLIAADAGRMLGKVRYA